MKEYAFEINVNYGNYERFEDRVVEASSLEEAERFAIEIEGKVTEEETAWAEAHGTEVPSVSLFCPSWADGYSVWLNNGKYTAIV